MSRDLNNKDCQSVTTENQNGEPGHCRSQPMTNELKPCGCGKVPTSLAVDYYGENRMHVRSEFCVCNWLVRVSSADDALQAWNAAPRPEQNAVTPLVLEYMKGGHHWACGLLLAGGDEHCCCGYDALAAKLGVKNDRA